MAHLIGIQAPSIDIKFFDPVTSNFQEIVLNIRILCIQLRHMRGKCKHIIRDIISIFKIFAFFIIDREFIDMEPIGKGRICTILNDIEPLVGSISYVIENCVKHDLDSSFMTFLHQPFKGLVIPKCRINR